MPKITSITFKGQSGNSYQFDTYPKDTKFNDVSAVYIFVKRYLEKGKYYQEILYIGESGELGTRINNHEKWKCVELHGCTHISVMSVSGQAKRLQIETDLIHKFNPVCNRQ